MAKNIEPQLRKIGEYLKLDEDAIFIIPDYQRPSYQSCCANMAKRTILIQE